MRAFLLMTSWKLYWRGELLAQDGVLALQVLDLDDAADQQRDLLGIAGLDDVLLRALLHRGDGGVDRGVGGDDDDGRLGMQAADLHHGFDAVHAARHFEIDEIDGVVAGAGLLDGLAAGSGGVDVVSVFAQPGGQRFAHDLFVVDDQDLPVGVHMCDSLGPACSRPLHGAAEGGVA